jgi:hypothetical protein
MSENTNTATGGNARRSMSSPVSIFSGTKTNNHEKTGNSLKNRLKNSVMKLMLKENENSSIQYTSIHHQVKSNINDFDKEDVMKIDMLALYIESAIEILKERLRILSI